MEPKRRKISHFTPISTKLNVKEPQTVQDLITHSRKVAEVRAWLEQFQLAPHILLVSGPSGSAKTTTLKLVAKSLSIDVIEWINPLDKIDYNERGVSQSAAPYDSTTYTEPTQLDKFEAFAFRSSRYQSLFSSNTNRIILVEDFPNHFIWKPETFFEFLSKYKKTAKCPIVFICTDDQKINLGQDLFPNNIRDQYCITNIKFNPVTNAGLMKVLKQSAAFLSKEVLNNIAQNCNGDIRAALSSLEFLLNGTRMVSQNISKLIAKDTATDFFQTIGRVLYPKRNEQPNPKVFLHDIEAIAEHYSSTFLLMLQENFISTFSSLDDVVNGCDVLSDCEVLCRGGDEMDKYVGYTCVTGLMLANRVPKKGTFRAMNRSRWTGLAASVGNVRLYSQIEMSKRTLNLDLIPYLKLLPQFAGTLSETDADRLRCVTLGSKALPLFKIPPTPCDAHTHDDEMIIEEFQD